MHPTRNECMGWYAQITEVRVGLYYTDYLNHRVFIFGTTQCYNYLMRGHCFTKQSHSCVQTTY